MAGVKVTDLPVLATADQEDVLYIVDTSDDVSKQISVEDFLGYKVYTALLNQTGTDAPIPTILKNTIGTITWDYISEGVYTANSLGLFTVNKTWCVAGSSFDVASFVNVAVTIGNQDNSTLLPNLISLKVEGGDFNGDSILQDTAIEIRVYN